MRPSQKHLDQMNRLSDMLHFPAPVNAGATANVLLTILLTWHVQPRYPRLLLLWIAVILFANLLPVIVLRLTLNLSTSYPALADMNFFRDQHKFSDWVYLAASANMTFWILLAWTLSSLHRTRPALLLLELAALLATFSPVILRSRLRN